MVHEASTSLPPPAVIERAKRFFAERVPLQAAFLEKEGPNFATFRGQGGEEIAVAAFASEGGTRVRASTPLFDGAVDRFLSTLPPAGSPASA